MTTMSSKMTRLWAFSVLMGCGPAVSPSSEDGTTSAAGSTSADESTGRDVPEPATVSSSAGESTASPTSGSDSGGTSGSSESSTGEGVTFIVGTGGCALPDGVYGHCTIECTVEAQDCGRGESCDAWANDGGDVWNASRCNPIPDDAGQRGDPCTVEGSAVSGLHSCDAGLMCWNVDPESLMGECVDHCDSMYACGVETDTCSIFNNGFLPLCLPACNPLESSCGEGFGCYPDSEGSFVCVREGENVHLAGDFHPHCPSGSLVVDEECVPFCDVTAEDACEGGGSCETYYEFGSPPPGLENVGYCAMEATK